MIYHPAGEHCLICKETITPGGLAAPCGVVDDTGSGVRWIHIECQALGVVGHEHGMCSCTGYDTTSRAAALELWARMYARCDDKTPSENNDDD